MTDPQAVPSGGRPAKASRPNAWSASRTPRTADFAAIALAGMLGTLARAAVATWIPGELGTLAVNTSGAFALGLLWQSLAERWRPALITGFLGAFTTFSTLAADLATKPLAQLAGDGALSLLLGLAAAGLGLQIERRLRARP